MIIYLLPFLINAQTCYVKNVCKFCVLFQIVLFFSKISQLKKRINQRVQFTKRAKYLRLFSRVDWTFERFIIKGLSCSTRPASDKSLRVSRPPFLPFIDRRPSSWPPSVFSSLGPELIRVGTNLSLQQSLYPEKNLSHLSQATLYYSCPIIIYLICNQ